eukprot:2374388-Rhodomonas_salina.1
MGGAEQSCSQNAQVTNSIQTPGLSFRKREMEINYEKLCPITSLVQLALQDTVFSCSVSVEQPSGVTGETNAV